MLAQTQAPERVAQRRRREAWSVFDVPEEILPDSIPLLLLTALAHFGYGIGFTERRGVWYVTIDRLGELRGDPAKSSLQVAEWVRDYPRILSELGYVGASL